MEGLVAFSRTSNHSSFVTLISQRNVKQIPSDRILTSSTILLPQILLIANENLRNTIGTIGSQSGVGLFFLHLWFSQKSKEVCSPSPVLQSNGRVQQKLGSVALPYTSKFTLSNTAVTCWVCFPSQVLHLVFPDLPLPLFRNNS